MDAPEIPPSSEAWRGLVERAPVPLVLLSSDATVVYCNDATARLLGVDAPLDLIGTDAFEYVHPDDADRFRASFGDVLANGGFPPIRFRFVDESGETRVGRCAATTTAVGDAAALELVVFDDTAVVDLDELRAARQFDAPLASNRDVFVEYTLDGDLKRWNDALESVTGYGDDELSTMSLYDLVPSTDRDVLRAVVSEAFETGTGSVNTHLVTNDGTQIPYEGVATRLGDGTDRFAIVVGSARDERERDRLDAQIEERDRLVQALFDGAFDAILVADDDGRYVDVNEAACQLFDRARDELVGHEISAFVPDEWGVDERWREFKRGDLVHGVVPIRRPDGDVRLCEYVATPNILPDRNLSILRDVTHRERQADELRAQNEALSTFAGEVSHDLRNPLTIAQGFLELFRETGDESALDDVERSLERMNGLVERLLTLAQQGSVVDSVEPVALGEAADEVWEYVDGRTSTLTVVDDCTVEANPGRFDQLLLNLFHNAVENGGDGVEIRVGRLDDDGFYVEDTGPGIPRDSWTDLFTVGFTTKGEPGGFGLTIVKQVVRAHGWSISVAESHEGGARFEIRDVTILSDGG